MSSFDAFETLEYQALTTRSRDAERTGQISWLMAGTAGAVLLAWAIAARNPALMLPVVVAVTFGHYSMMRCREQVRLIAGYVEEYFEGRDQSQHWFSGLRRVRNLPSFHPTGDWIATILANAVNIIAIAGAWLFASASQRGDLWAGVVTGCGIVFAYHSFTETGRLMRTDYLALWRQDRPRDVRRHMRAA